MSGQRDQLAAVLQIRYSFTLEEAEQAIATFE